nr:ATP synthase F0 subunit 8 [Hemerocallis citrina]
MPQLDKFTYFTQFFWLCLILFTFYIPICNDGDGVLGISRILKLRNISLKVKDFIFRMELSLFFKLLFNNNFRMILVILKFLFLCCFLYFRIISPFLGFASFFGVLPMPIEISILEGYLQLPEQDPLWLDFVRERLSTCPPSELTAQISSFLSIERCFACKAEIISLFSTLYFSREDICPLPPFFIEKIVNDSLSEVEFSQESLSTILRNLCLLREHSPFYSGVLEANSELINARWQEQYQEQIERERFHREVEEMQNRVWTLERHRAALVKQITNIGPRP